jgi:hypothetical protein
VSALTGEGLDALRAVLEERVRAREAATARLAADVVTAASGLAAAAGAGAPGKIDRGDRAALTAALSDAAGVPSVIRAVAAAHRRRGALATGWPFIRWLRRLRPDPLRRLRLADRTDETRALPAARDDGTATPAHRDDGTAAPARRDDVTATPARRGDGTAAPAGRDEGRAGGGERALVPATRSSLPAPTRVQLAQVQTAARQLAARAAGDLHDPWPGLVRQAALTHDDELPARLETAVSGADLRMRTPRWWRAAGALQVVLAVLAVGGALWLLALAGLGYLQLDDAIPTPEVEGFPVPTLLLGGGVLAGLLIAALAGFAIRAGARRRARVAAKALEARVRTTGEELVIAPVEAELDARRRLTAALDVAGAADLNRSLVINPAR